MTSINPPSPIPFVAPWPKELEPTNLSIAAQKVYNLLSIFPLFPLGITRFSYYSLQDLAGRVIHPASGENPNILRWNRQALIDEGGEEITLGTPDGEKINAMLFRGAYGSRGAIVRAVGNSYYYETSGRAFLDMVHSYVGRDVDVLMFNPRGCGKSTGRSFPAGLALDAYSAGEYLVQKENQDPSRILFYGHSLGGYYGVAGGGLFQKEHPEARVSGLSDRSFSSLSKVVYVIMGTPLSHLVRLLNWELDAKRAWEELKGRKIVVYDKRDNCIPYEASFHKYICNAEIKKQIHDPLYTPNVFEIEMRTPNFVEVDAHNRSFTEEEGEKIGRHIRDAILS